MANQSDITRYRENLQAERDAIVLYTHLAQAEPKPELASVYQRLVDSERRHAEVWADKLKEAGVAGAGVWRILADADARLAGTAFRCGSGIADHLRDRTGSQQ